MFIYIVQFIFLQSSNVFKCYMFGGQSLHGDATPSLSLPRGFHFDPCWSGQFFFKKNKLGRADLGRADFFLLKNRSFGKRLLQNRPNPPSEANSVINLIYIYYRAFNFIKKPSFFSPILIKYKINSNFYMKHMLIYSVRLLKANLHVLINNLF